MIQCLEEEEEDHQEASEDRETRLSRPWLYYNNAGSRDGLDSHHRGGDQLETVDLIRHAVNLMSALGAPKVEMRSFDGDPRRYHMFIRYFEQCIERTVDDSVGRLIRLV